MTSKDASHIAERHIRRRGHSCHTRPSAYIRLRGKSADDASDVRAAIERHYQAINAQEETRALSDHLGSFTMFPGDGGLLFESDWAEVQQRVGQDYSLPELDVRMTHFHAQIYGDVAIATFYLVGTQTVDDAAMPLNNRVSAVWIKQDGSWKEAHHHESPLLD